MVFAINQSYKDFQPGAEESLAKAFDSQIQKKGFKPVAGKNNWFKNDKTGMCVGLSYDKGSVTLMCAYTDKYMNFEVERIPRDDSTKDDAQVDYIDTFGLEGISDVDSIAVVEASLVGDTLVSL